MGDSRSTEVNNDKTESQLSPVSCILFLNLRTLN